MAKQIKTKSPIKKPAVAKLNYQESPNQKGEGSESIPNKRMIITVLYVLGSTLVFVTLILISASHGNENRTAFIILLILNLILSPSIGGSLQKSLITVARCSHCGTMIDLVGIWKCSCGYASKMHVFDKCKNCEENFGYIPCPKCEVAIDI